MPQLTPCRFTLKRRYRKPPTILSPGLIFFLKRFLSEGGGAYIRGAYTWTIFCVSVIVINKYSNSDKQVLSIVIINGYWPSVRSVLWNIRPLFFSMDRATKEVHAKNRGLIFHSTDRTARSIIGLIYGWTESVSIYMLFARIKSAVVSFTG